MKVCTRKYFNARISRSSSYHSDQVRNIYIYSFFIKPLVRFTPSVFFNGNLSYLYK